jgi:hypothetical protein
MTGVTRALLAIGSPIELYIALDTDSVVTSGVAPDMTPAVADGCLLMTRHAGRQNAIQGFTAAGLLFFAATLAELGDVDVFDRGAPGNS